MLSLLAFIISVGTLFLTATPCHLVNAQTVCEIGDDVVITDDLTLQNELRVGATPSAGTNGQVLQSQGSGNSPEWVDVLLTRGNTRKLADQSVSASTTLQDDSNFSFTLFDANSSYYVSGILLINSPTATDIKFNWDWDGTGATGWGYITSYDDIFKRVILDVDVTVETDDTGTGHAHVFQFIFNTGADVSGHVLDLTWAQNVASGTTTIREDSWLSIAKVE